MRQQGKYQKQARNQINIYVFFAVALVVFGISAVGFYKMGEKSAAGSQQPEHDSRIVIQETVAETAPVVVSVTEPIIVETTNVIKETTQQTTEPAQLTEATQPVMEETTPSTRTGTVLRSAGELNVRSGAGTNYSKIGLLRGGEAVTIYEETTVGETVWGNIGYGWVSMDYIVFGIDTSMDSTYIGSTVRKDDYFGDWLSGDGKCHMSIIQNGSGASINVIHTITDNVDMTWSMYGEFDEHGAIRYWNGVRKDHNLGMESLKYTNGEGAIVLDGLSLSWHESAEGPGEAGRFEKVYNYRPSSGNGNQNSPSQDNGTTNTTEIPRRFGSDDIKKVLEKEAKIELGYRHGDEFEISIPILIAYKSDTGKYSVASGGRWCGKNYYISAILQDVNGVLTTYRVLSFEFT